MACALQSLLYSNTQNKLVRFIFLFITVFLNACFPNQLFAQPMQVLRGVVTDDVSQQPIANASIVVFSDTVKMETITDANGVFRFYNIPLGRHLLLVSSVGYQDKSVTNIVVTAGKEVIVNIELTEKVTELEKITINYNKRKDKKSVNNEFLVNSSRSFNIEDTRMFAGSLGDPSRMAANFAGVIGANDARNDIIIRGNSPTGLLWQLEGIPIPNPNHFGTLNTSGGPISLINNNVLDKSDFLTGAFPAQYGNALSGVFDLQLRNGNNENHELLLQLGLNGIEAGAEGPLHSKLENASYLINYRYSTIAPFVKLGVDVGTGGLIPVYQDLNFKFHIPTKKKLKINLFGIGGSSKANFPGNEVDTTLSNFYSNETENNRIKTTTGIAGISLENSFNKKTFFKIIVAASTTRQQTEVDSVEAVNQQAFPSIRSFLNTVKYSVHALLKHKISQKNNIAIGVLGDFTLLQLNRKRIYGGGLLESALLNDTVNNVFVQGYAQWKHRFTDKFSLVAGVHAQYFNVNNEAVAEPRLGLQYALLPNHSLALSYGLHNTTQSPYLYYLRTYVTADSVVFTNRPLSFTRAHHFVASYDYNISKFWRLRTEWYYQYISRVPVEKRASSYSAINTGIGFMPIENDSLVNKGSGINYGMEITLEKFFSKGYYFLWTASLFNSTYKASDQINRNTAFNNKYVVNLLAGKEIMMGKKNIISFNIRLASTGGRWLTPIDQALSAQKGEAVFLENEAFSIRQTRYFRADVKFGYRRELRRSTLELGIDLQNITDSKNVFAEQYNRRKGAIVTQYQQGFLPVPSLRWTFL
jgi:hypothetical protein